jgi:hypothetical protein
MRSCTCQEDHSRKRIVLTGGPGAGKTAVLELVRQYFCEHVRILPESASILFGGGFPRGMDPGSGRASQRAIFYVQRELERGADSGKPAIVLCDRGTVEGSAYWIGPGELWPEVGTTREAELRRYDAVIHLRTPGEVTVAPAEWANSASGWDVGASSAAPPQDARSSRARAAVPLE